MSSYEGTFDLTRIDLCQTLVLIAAGTGLTPMIRVINYALQQTNDKKRMKIILLFFNKTQKDILCGDQLETLSSQYKSVQKRKLICIFRTRDSLENFKFIIFSLDLIRSGQGKQGISVVNFCNDSCRPKLTY